VYGTWAASGEIDIVEYRGQAALGGTVEGSLHYGAAWPANAYTGSGRVAVPGTDFSQAPHTFALEWVPDAASGRPALMRWLVDGEELHRQRLDISWSVGPASPYTQAGQPWDQRFHLVLNLAVGGGFFPPAEFGGFASEAQWDAAVATWQRPRLEVEHVKLWRWPPPGYS
jgi:beta-glucanase (GH16 family)